MTCIEAHPDPSRWLPASLATHNRLPVQHEHNGKALIGCQQLQLPVSLQKVVSTGTLAFPCDSACLLLGPWGPDPRKHLVLRGRLNSICVGDNRLSLQLEVDKELPLIHLSLSCRRYNNLRLKHGQRLWISVPESSIRFEHA